MGVMACSRRSCERIMCDTYISSIGYICEDCQEEFKNYMANKHIDTEYTEHEIVHELTEFMDTDKGTFDTKSMSVDAFFDNHTRKD